MLKRTYNRLIGKWTLVCESNGPSETYVNLGFQLRVAATDLRSTFRRQLSAGPTVAYRRDAQLLLSRCGMKAKEYDRIQFLDTGWVHGLKTAGHAVAMRHGGSPVVFQQ